MLNKDEIITIAIIIVILSFLINFIQSIETFFYTLLAVSGVILLNIFAKKLMGFYLDSEIEIKLWTIKQYGFRISQHFKKPFPIGAFIPIISKAFLFPVKGLIWMACLVFDVKPKIYRSAKRHGLYSFSEITESHMGLIAAAGIITNLICAVIGYFIGFHEFSKLSLFYAFFNMLPISDLDGNKIFFGNIILWSFLASLVLVGLFLALFIV